MGLCILDHWLSQENGGLMKAIKLVLALVLCASLPVQAEIYKYVDESGRVTYSNIPKKGAQKLDLEPLSTINSQKPKTSVAPQNFPKVDQATQKKRDDMRRKLLQEELAAEEQKLDDAKKALKEGEAVRLGSERNYQKYLDRVQSLKDNVTVHEKNIEALKKELGEAVD